MLVTSVSLPSHMAALWRRQQKRILRLAPAELARELRIAKLRRGVKRRYNRGSGMLVIVTTRFSGEQYDTLHAAAAAMRVSVSLLIFQLILLWKQLRKNRCVIMRPTNYELVVHEWGTENVCYTEMIHFRRAIMLRP